jgi:murein peptide amidase A
MSHRREVAIGHSVLGRPIEAVHLTPPSYARPRPAALLVGALHGDEPVAQLMLERLADDLVERPPGRDTWIVPCVNVDGMLAGTRTNANDVDLDRNFACPRWGSDRRPGEAPGTTPEDQPETQAIVGLVERTAAHRLVVVQATHRAVRWTGLGESLAREVASRCGYPLQPDPCPAGSFASKYGERQLEVVTIESPYLLVDEDAWLECRDALRWCVDLPD